MTFEELDEEVREELLYYAGLYEADEGDDFVNDVAELEIFADLEIETLEEAFEKAHKKEEKE